MLTTERLKMLFEYDMVTGKLTRTITLSRRSKVGEAIGFVGKNGYLYASVDSKTYPLHRLIWKWHGLEDGPFLDHINCDVSDNRIENLRPATRHENMQNRGIPKNNTSGVKGVVWKADKQKWRVRVGVNGKRIHVGDFEDFELAELVAIEARNKFHGQFANSH